MRKRVVILASGTGSLTQAIMDATELDIQIVAVVSDRADAQVLERAKKANINTSVIELQGDRGAWAPGKSGRSAGWLLIVGNVLTNSADKIRMNPALMTKSGWY